MRGTGVDETVVLRHGGSVLATMAGRSRPGDRAAPATTTSRAAPASDRLFGGGGKDVAIGGPGTDTCRKVEFKKGCELPGLILGVPELSGRLATLNLHAPTPLSLAAR